MLKHQAKHTCGTDGECVSYEGLLRYEHGLCHLGLLLSNCKLRTKALDCFTFFRCMPLEVVG